MITVSFDETDTPQIARDVKKNYIKAAGSAFPEDGWKFLTGDRESIDRLTQAVGFRFRKEIHGFNHPVVLIFLSPEGKISKYLPVTKYAYGADYPITFSSFDLNMALDRGRSGKGGDGAQKGPSLLLLPRTAGAEQVFQFHRRGRARHPCGHGGFFHLPAGLDTKISKGKGL